MKTIKILLIDDDARFRARVKEILHSESDLEVVGEAADGQEAIARARELRPDLAIMDVRMPGLNGFNATRQLKGERPELKVIFLSIFDLAEYKTAARNSGASDYVIKKLLLTALLPAIRAAFVKPADGGLLLQNNQQNGSTHPKEVL